MSPTGMTTQATAPKETPVTTKTAPLTAAEARALAERLTAEERERETKRRADAKAAKLTEARRLLDEDAVELDKARARANAAWGNAAEDPDAGIDVLFSAWQELRATSAARAAHVAQAAGVLDQLEPLRHGLSGQSMPHRADVHDPLRGHTFSAAVDGVLEARVWKRAQAATDAVEAAVEAAANAVDG